MKETKGQNIKQTKWPYSELVNLGVAIILVFAGIIIFVVLSRYYSSPIAMVQPQIEEVEKDDVDVEEFTEQELSYLNGINLEPVVKYIRQGIKNYLDDSGYDTQTEGLPNCGFSKFEEYLSSKYVAFQMEPAKYGGQIVRIIFRDKPDQIFEGWIYELADGTFDLRSFCSALMPESEVKAMIKAFGKLLKNDKMAL